MSSSTPLSRALWLGFALTVLATVNADSATNHFAIVLPGRSITAWTTFQLADDADGITQE